MDLLVVVAAYFGLIGLLFLSLLFGEQTWAARTPLSFIHWLVTSGTCLGIEKAVNAVCGERGRAALAGCEEACCEKSNPLVQLLFLVLLGGCYAAYNHAVFPLFPGAGIPHWHIYLGSAGALATLALFAAASFCDPGIITPHNLEAHLALYPHDGLLFAPGRRCPTCGLPKPARSKHDRILNRCIARSDHFCIWLNAPVGLLNTRWFLGLLAAVAALCAYGGAFAIRAVLGDMRRRDAWSSAYIHPRTQRVVFLGDSWYATSQYISRTYGLQAALAMFLLVMGWVVLGFLAYHLYLVAIGVTTNESYKRRELAGALRAQAEQERLMARVDVLLAGEGGEAGSGGMTAEQAGRRSSRSSFSGGGGSGGHAELPAALPPHPYNRGVFTNFGECLWPHFYLKKAAAAKKRS